MTTSNYDSITSGKWTPKAHPLISGAVLLAVSVLVMLAARASSPAAPWQVCTVSMLFFAVYNQVNGLFLQKWPKYVGVSYLAYIAYTVLLLVIASALAEAPLSTLPKFKKAYVLLGVFFMMLTMLAGVYRVALFMIASPRKP